MKIITGKRITPHVYSNLELTKLKQYNNIEYLFLSKLEQLFSTNSNIRYMLIRYLDSNLNEITHSQLINKLKEWNIEIDYDINEISIQQILNYIR